MSARLPAFSTVDILKAQQRAMVLDDERNGSRRSKTSPVVMHRCQFCDELFIGVRQKKYCQKPCVEAACRARRSALIDALTLEFASYGLNRAQVEMCADKFLERCQQVAAAFHLQYFEHDRMWRKPTEAIVLRSV